MLFGNRPLNILVWYSYPHGMVNLKCENEMIMCSDYWAIWLRVIKMANRYSPPSMYYLKK